MLQFEFRRIFFGQSCLDESLLFKNDGTPALFCALFNSFLSTGDKNWQIVVFGIKMIIIRTTCCAGWRLDDCDRENCPLLQDPQSIHFSGTIITQYYSKFKLKVLTCHLSSWRLLTFHSWHTCDQISNSSQFTYCTTSPIQHLPDTRTFEVSLITLILLH